MGWLLQILGVKNWMLYAGIAGLFALLLAAVALTFWSKGRASRVVDILNAQIKEQRRALDIRKKQMEDAANRPGDDDLDGLLHDGEF